MLGWWVENEIEIVYRGFLLRPRYRSHRKLGGLKRSDGTLAVLRHILHAEPSNNVSLVSLYAA
jgi:hypothetical protein